MIRFKRRRAVLWNRSLRLRRQSRIADLLLEYGATTVLVERYRGQLNKLEISLDKLEQLSKLEVERA